MISHQILLSLKSLSLRMEVETCPVSSAGSGSRPVAVRDIGKLQISGTSQDDVPLNQILINLSIHIHDHVH